MTLVKVKQCSEDGLGVLETPEIEPPPGTKYKDCSMDRLLWYASLSVIILCLLI